MNSKYIEIIARELQIEDWQARATAQLLSEGATVPFISRYRKEATGSLDEVAIAGIRDRLDRMEELDKRREAILQSIDDQGKLDKELEEKIRGAETLTVLEDIYLPFKPKRRTRASIAREKGLEPLAELIFSQKDIKLNMEATAFIDQEKGVESIEDALSGACDIIAEWINEDQEARDLMRALFFQKGAFISKVVPDKEKAGQKFKDYFDWQEPVDKAPSHRILAMRRGEKEGFIRLHVIPPEETAITLLEKKCIIAENDASERVKMAVHDSYKRLLSFSMETEIRLETKKRADKEAIQVFVKNLRQLLLASPLGQKSILGIDPGFRTGCKVVCLNAQGKLEYTDTIYPLLSRKGKADAELKVVDMCGKFDIDAIAIGNGTGGRETEAFVRALSLPEKVKVVMVNESGASIYSASEVAREEFPDHDITVRGAISIGRRLMDPLAELVKIDPKSIGVGQYQHDVDQKKLKKSLDDTIMSCVNSIGVEINTASRQLLAYVSGLGPQLAKNIIAYRDEYGPFSTREEIKNVPRLGARAFEQAAGFLRIRHGDNPLDGSAVHPENYPIVKAMARDIECSIKELVGNEGLLKKIDKKNYISEEVGIPTLVDILMELASPGRDPREQFEHFAFTEGVEKIEDLEPGMKLPGVITNITAFGAFVDIGVHQDGLVHISQIADLFIKDPNDIVKVHQKVSVTVLNIDHERKRIALSMKKDIEISENGEVVKSKSGHNKKKSGKRREPVDKSFNNPFAKALMRR